MCWNDTVITSISQFSICADLIHIKKKNQNINFKRFPKIPKCVRHFHVPGRLPFNYLPTVDKAQLTNYSRQVVSERGIIFNYTSHFCVSWNDHCQKENIQVFNTFTFQHILTSVNDGKTTLWVWISLVSLYPVRNIGNADFFHCRHFDISRENTADVNHNINNDWIQFRFPGSGSGYYVCWLTGIDSWDTYWTRAIANIIRYTCASHVKTSFNVCCERSVA